MISVVYSSSDAINWTRVAAAQAIGGNAGLYTPAVAGVTSNVLIARPDYPTSGWTKVYSVAHSNSSTVQLVETTGVGLGYGPTPTLATVP